VEGWRNHLTLGAHFRKRYIEELIFLPHTLNTSLLYIRSTDSPRTVASVSANLLGLYPIKYRTNDDNYVDIFTMDASNEDILPSTTCNTLMNSCYNLQNTSLWLNQLNKMNNLSTYFKNEWKTDKLPWWIGIFDNLYSRKFHNIPFPKSVTKQVYKEVKDNALWQLKELYRPDIIKTLGIGRFVDELIDVFDGVSSMSRSRDDSVRYIHYSAHDITISLLLSTYGLLDDIISWPKFASSIQLELYYHHDIKEYMVQFMYNERVLNIPSCGNSTLCRYTQFKDISNKYIPKDYTTMCNKEVIIIKNDLMSQFMC